MKVFVTISDGGQRDYKRHFWNIAPGRYHAQALVRKGDAYKGFGAAYHNDPAKAEYKAVKKAQKELALVEETHWPIRKNYELPS